MRHRAVCALGAVIVAVAAGCGGSDDRPDIAVATPTTEAPVTTAVPPEQTRGDGGPQTVPSPRASALTPAARSEFVKRAADVDLAIGRWDDELAACVGGNGDDQSATCTHAAWERLTFQMEIAVYYLVPRLREMSRGGCHDALSAQVRTIRGFWNGAASLNLAWLDERQEPPDRLDLAMAVDILRRVPERVFSALANACAT